MTKQTKNPKRSIKSKPVKRSSSIRIRLRETDSTYFLKLVVVLIAGTLWLKFADPVKWMGIYITALPLGIVVGILAVKYFEKRQEDRKIWYAVLLVVGVISYFVPAGIVI